MDARTVSLVLACLGAVSASQLCPLTDLKVWPRLQEESINGSWFEMRSYPAGEFGNYENHAIELTWSASLPGYYVRETYRNPAQAPCTVISEAPRRRIAKGIYEYTLDGKTVRQYVYYTDPEEVLGLTICYDFDDTYCYKADTSIYYRQPFKRRNVVCPYPERIKSALEGALGTVCVDTARFKRSLHRPGACAPVTNPVMSEIGPPAGPPTPPPGPRTCSLSNVRVETGYDFEARIAGTWFEARWYYADKPVEYENYAYDVTPVASGLRVRAVVKDPVEDPCRVDEDSVRTRIGPSQYEYYSTFYVATVKSFISYLDDKYMVEFICLASRGDICDKSEVNIFTRTPCKFGEICLDETLLKNLNVEACIDTTKYRNTPQRKPTCLRETYIPVKPDYGYDKELLEAMKAREVAAKEKFEVEKEKLAAEKELIQLQIKYMTRGYFPGKK